jgi:hypothetical protein
VSGLERLDLGAELLHLLEREIHHRIGSSPQRPAPRFRRPRSAGALASTRPKLALFAERRPDSALSHPGKFASSEHRKEALGLSASLLDDDQHYTRAADIYKKYSDAISSKPQDSAQAYFFACNAYEKAHETNKQSGCLRDFIKKFNKQQEAGEYIVQAYAKQAVITENSTRNKDKIIKAYKRVRDEYRSRKLPGATPAAAFAAKADFLIMKEKFKPFQRMELKLGGNPLPRDARIGLEYP